MPTRYLLKQIDYGSIIFSRVHPAGSSVVSQKVTIHGIQSETDSNNTRIKPDTVSFGAVWKIRPTLTMGYQTYIRVDDYRELDVSDAPLFVNWYWLSDDVKKLLFGG